MDLKSWENQQEEASNRKLSRLAAANTPWSRAEDVMASAALAASRQANLTRQYHTATKAAASVSAAPATKIDRSCSGRAMRFPYSVRSEEHTSELQSPC